MQELYAGYGWALDVAIAGNEPDDKFLFTFRHHGHATTFGPMAPTGGLLAIRLSGAETGTLPVGSHAGELVLLRDEGAAVIPLETQFLVHKAGTPPRLAGDNPQPLTASNGAPFTIIAQSSPDLTLSIQRSVAGPAGPSAYDIAAQNGFVGSEAEWLESLGGTALQSRIAALEVLVADLTGGTTVTPTAPSFVATPSLSPDRGDLGTVFTVSKGSAIGYPDPLVRGVLTLNGVDVTGDLVGGTTYTATATGTLLWTVNAVNVLGTASDSAQGLVQIASDVAPTFASAPTIVPQSGTVGTVFTVSNGTVVGMPDPVVAGLLTVNGIDVTAQMSGNTYTATGAGTLLWSVTATNSQGSAAQSAVGTVSVATGTAPSFSALPSLSPASGGVGTVFTLSEGVASGNPAPVLAGTLTLDGVDVTAQISGSTYTATTAGTLLWSVTATNSEGTAAQYASGTVTAATGTAPSFSALPSLTPAAGDVGTVFTLSEGVASGNPAPVLTGTLTLDGVDVTADMSGSTYTATAAGTLVWSVTATNSEGTASESAAGTVAVATGAAPSFTALPSLAPASGDVGTVFTLSEGVASGDPAPVLTGTLTLDGVDVTADMSANTYTAAAAGALVWSVTATNSEGAASESATGTVRPASSWAGANLFTAGQSDFTDVSSFNDRGNWDFSTPGQITQIPGNGSTNDVRMPFGTSAMTAGEPHIVLWSTVPGSTNANGYRLQMAVPGTKSGATTKEDSTSPKFWWLPASDVSDPYSEARIRPSYDDNDTVFTSIAAYNLSDTDPTTVACDVVLCLGDSNMTNSTSDFATEDNLETAFDGRVWYMPGLAPHNGGATFATTNSTRHVPQPCMEPVIHSDNAVRMSPLMAFGGTFVEWSAARGRPLLLLALGDAGSGFDNSEDWRKTSSRANTGSRMWNEMLAMLAALDALGPNHQIVGAIVSLGANDTTGADYEISWGQRAAQWIDDVRAEVGIANLPIAWAGLNPDYEQGTYPNYDDAGAGLPRRCERLRTAQANLAEGSGSPNARANVVFVPSVAGESYTGAGNHIPDAGGKTKEVHFTAAGMQANGRALATALRGLLEA